MRLHTADTISGLEPNRESGRFNYIKRLVQQGPDHLVKNAHVTACALEIDGQLIPLILSDGNSDDAMVCSIEAHYVDSPGRQLHLLGTHFHSTVARPFLGLLKHIIRAGRLGRVVFLNDWLLTTNLPVHLSASQLDAVTRFLIARFPDRAIVVRSVDPLTRPDLQCALLDRGYDLIRSRRVYVFDPRRPDFEVRNNLRKDLRLLRQWPGTIKRPPLDDEELQRVAELYRSLYLQKYSAGNPEFTDEFFRAVINEGLFECRCLVQNGEILAFTSWQSESDSMLGTLVGHDLSRNQKMGLLRMAFALDFKESIDRRVPYHVSSGAGQFKRLRGAFPTPEYDAVHSRHLGLKQRLCWKLFRALMYLAERSEGEMIDFKRAPRSER